MIRALPFVALLLAAPAAAQGVQTQGVQTQGVQAPGVQAPGVQTQGVPETLPPLPPPPGPYPTAPYPTGQPGAARVQTIDYVEDRVITLQGLPGYQIAVEFGGDERIENVSVGDSAAWTVTANKRGDHLFVKPLGGAMTNMVVVTDRRLYAFDLVPASGGPGDLVYAIRFRYPPAEGTQPPGEDAMAGRYRLHGAKALRPEALSDDGVHTYLQWPASVTLPAIYTLDSDGRETLAGGAMRGDTYVIDSIATRLVFRRDRAVAYADRLKPGK